MKKFFHRMKAWKNAKGSLKWGMVRMLLFGWFFPLLLMIFVLLFYVRGNSNRQAENTMQTSAEKAVEILKIQLEDCETASKNASYMKVISENYEKWRKDGREDTFNEEVTSFLRQQYKYNDNCRTAVFFLIENPDKLYYTYNSSNNAAYRDILFFGDEVRDKALLLSRDLDTGTTLLSCQGRLYLVRNLVDSKFRPYGVLTLELDSDSLRQSLEGIWGYADAALYWNGGLLLSGRYGAETPEELPDGVMEQLKRAGEVYERRSGSHSFLYRQIKIYDGTLECAVRLDNSVLYAEMGTVHYFFVILLIFMIPLVVLVFLFFHRQVTIPVNEMIQASDAVQQGHYGTQIVCMADSEEFYHMQDSFNHMSRELKNQFDKIYREEIALRDARIMALQSQINPHFLNNTLEIINWEARMQENDKVSGMIEALSTMLEATMNRKAQELHSLAEELDYVDAYLYIISQRFGEKFLCTRKIDESLLGIMVPRLIIQPIVENAVEHGMDTVRQGRVEIRLYRNADGYLCIEVEDNGHLTPKEQAKIARLLSEETPAEGEKRVSLGIRNVDQRLKMIYGPFCGLFITGSEQSHTVSTLLLKPEEGTAQ